MTTLACVICGNGYGHLKRTLSIVEHLHQVRPDVAITLYVDHQHHAKIARRASFAHIESLHLPLKWFTSGHAYADGAVFKATRQTLATLPLTDYDLVYTDNLVEPLFTTQQVVLGSSFLWHDVLHSAYPEVPTIQHYYDTIENLLDAHRQPMLANRYFQMPHLSTVTEVIPIGMISFVEPDGVPHTPPHNILLAPGNSSAVPELLTLITPDLRRLVEQGYTLKAGAEWQSYLFDLGVPSTAHDFGSFAGVDAVITRAGIGSVSDCITSRLPMLLIPDSNPEIRYNQSVIKASGLGFDLVDFETFDISPERFATFSLDGVIDAVRYLEGCL